MSLQADDMHPESYSRPRPPYQITDEYRVPSNSSRRPYVSERDVVPHIRREDDWRHRDLDHDRYPYNTNFSLQERADYEEEESRGSAGWGATRSSQYAQPALNWPSRFDTATPSSSSSSYPKGTTWGVDASNSYDHSRPPFSERWHADDPSMPLDDWSQEPPRNEHTSDRRLHDWQRNETRRDKNLGHKFQSDSGWESRRRDRSDWASEVSSSSRHDELLPRNGPHLTEERAWEPAASWKSTTSSEHLYQRSQNTQRSNHSRPKRGHSQVKQRRDWRSDDSDLNK